MAGEVSTFFATLSELPDNAVLSLTMIRLPRSSCNFLLALGVLLALFTALKGETEGGGPPVARIPPGHAVAGLTKDAQASHARPAKEGNTRKSPRKDLLVGDRDLRGEVDLRKRYRQGDHYEVPLAGGSTAVLTLDPIAQEAAEKVLAQAKSPMSAAVVMTTDGRILALTGRRQLQPTEDGASKEGPAAKADEYELALSVWAPAASIFKIVTASALLEAGVEPHDKVCYHGGFRSVDKSNLIDNPRADSACNDLGFGVAKSQNALIAKLAHNHLDPQSLGAMAANFGFGKAPAFALDSEPGRIQLPTDKLEFARVSAGFWSTEISPLGAALAANVVASHGMAVTPRIVLEVREKDRVVPVVTKVPERVLDAKVAISVAEMMTGTVRYGTAFKAFHDKRGRPYLANTKVAGKTGSLSRHSPSYLSYSWFVGFAPADDPQVVVAVLLGNSPKWHLKAHTAARLILDKLF